MPEKESEQQERQKQNQHLSCALKHEYIHTAHKVLSGTIHL